MKILIFDGTQGFSPRRIYEKPAGGIITSLTLIPQYLASKGHDVSVVSFYEGPEEKGVKYLAADSPYIKNPDVVIFNRNLVTRPVVEYFKCPKVWWLHDIVDPRYLEDDGYKHVDSIVALSQYCVDTYSEFYDIPKHLFTIIPNGVDTSVFYPTDRPRNRNLFLCASAPIKGLGPLSYLLSNMKRHNPDFELRIYSSQSLHDQKNEAVETRMLANLKAQGATVCEPVPQKELAEVMREAYCLLMPNSYPEICSNLLLQAQACGLPVIASDIGSVGEFIQHGVTGFLTSWKPHDLFMWQKNFTELAVDLWQKPAKHRLVSRVSPRAVQSWERIGAAWNEYLEILCQHRSSKNTLPDAASAI